MVAALGSSGGYLGRWFAEGRQREAPWADLCQQTVPHILGATERIERIIELAPDVVTTRGDFKTHNIVRSSNGPVLVDWDTVRTDSAALEARRVAYIFGAGEPDRVKRILAAYASAGGDLTWAGPDLFVSVIRNHLQVLSEHLRVALGEAPAARS